MWHHPACLPIDDLLAECRVFRGRRSGPGGQHRNKVETAIVIEHGPTGVRAEATERRSQDANRRVAIHRLRVRLAVEVRASPPAEGPRTPSLLWSSRLQGGRIAIREDHEDFPAVLAEALDEVHRGDDDLAAAAARLATTASQLLKLIKREPAAITQLNLRRRARGLHPLK